MGLLLTIACLLRYAVEDQYWLFLFTCGLIGSINGLGPRE